MTRTIRYKGYCIEFDAYREQEYTVQLQNGDDLWFRSEKDARACIDNMTAAKSSFSEDSANGIHLAGFFFLHPDGDREYWQVELPKDVEEKIFEILKDYDAEGSSVVADSLEVVDMSSFALAKDMEYIAYNFDHYDYMDNLEQHQTSLFKVTTDIENNNISYLIEFLDKVISESGEGGDSNLLSLAKKTKESLIKRER